MGLRQRLSSVYMEYTPDPLFAVSFNLVYGMNKGILIKKARDGRSWQVEGLDNGDSILLSPTAKFLNVHVKNFEDVFEKYFKIKEGDTCLDVGACIGDTTVFMKQKAGRNGKVIAVEPSSINIPYLKVNLSSMQNPNITVIEKGAWNKREVMTFYTNWTLTSNSLLKHTKKMRKEEVAVDTIDNMLDGLHVNFAKIDVQGTEVQALEGADHLLKTADKIIVETHWRTIKEKATYPQVLEIMKRYYFPKFKFEIETGLVYAWRV